MSTVESVQPVPASRPIGMARLFGFLLLPATAITACFNGIQQVLMPGQVEALDPTDKVARLALLTTFAAVGAMVGIPLGGALSDRTRSRFGKRTPWIVGLAIVSAVLMMGMGLSGDLLTLGIVYTMAWLAANMQQGALIAIVPDRVPVERRGLASAILGLATPAGALIGVNMASHLDRFWAYSIPAALLIVTSIALALGAREEPSLGRRIVVEGRSRKTWRELSGFFEAFRERDFTLAFISRFMLFLAYFTTSGYLFYTLSDYIGAKQVPNGNVPVAISTLLTISVGAWVLIATFCGWLADRIDRRKLFVGVSALGLAATMAVPVISPTWTGMVVYSALIGVFIGVYFAVDIAVMSLVLPHKDHEGRDFGILAVATGLPQIMSSAVAGTLITYAGGYKTLYLFGGLCALVAGVVVLFIKKVR